MTTITVSPTGAITIKVNEIVAPTVVSDATYTFAATDNGKVFSFTNATSCLVTLPANMDAGFIAEWGQDGAGTITFTPAAGGSLVNLDNHNKSGGLYSEGAITCRSNTGTAAVWKLVGATTA